MPIRKIQQTIPHIKADVFGFADLTKYAVLLPLVEVAGDIHILFEVRSYHMRRQPGEISFPGGKVDADDASERAAAIRETSEELGVAPYDIEVLGDLGVLIPPVQIAIYSYIGWIRDVEALKPNPDEVAHVFTVPLDYLLQTEPEAHDIRLGLVPTEVFPFELIPGGREYKFRERNIPEYFYFYEDRIIWGLTARILKQFLDQLKAIL